MPPPVVTAINEGGVSPYVLLCEHASNHVPDRYAGLGVAAPDMERHIAWDIGAAELAQHLSRRLDAPLFLSGISRLVIDCNRPLGTPTSIPSISESTPIPGNQGLSDAERDYRASAYFTPFQDRVRAALDRRTRAGTPTILIGIHSFTPVFHGVVRPWHAGVLYAQATTLGHALVAGIEAGGGVCVGDNEPYQILPDEDHTVPVHGDARGIPAALIEVRQDLVASSEGVLAWAGRLAAALSGAVPSVLTRH